MVYHEVISCIGQGDKEKKRVENISMQDFFKVLTLQRNDGKLESNENGIKETMQETEIMLEFHRFKGFITNLREILKTEIQCDLYISVCIKKMKISL